jgi:hypothetical protein
MNTTKAQEAKTMKYAKGTLITLNGSKQNYRLVGKWHNAWVLASEDPRDTEIVMYTENEIEEEIEAGRITVI